MLLALPLLKGVSSGLAGVGLSVGIDEARRDPVAVIGYLGTINDERLERMQLREDR